MNTTQQHPDPGFLLLHYRKNKSLLTTRHAAYKGVCPARRPQLVVRREEAVEMGAYFIPTPKTLNHNPCARRPQLVAHKEEAVEMGGYFIRIS